MGGEGWKIKEVKMKIGRANINQRKKTKGGWEVQGRRNKEGREI